MKDDTPCIKTEFLDGILYLEPYGEIDHHSAKALRERMDKELYFYRPRVTILGLSKIGFMDSSGLGLILGRYTKMKELGGSLKLEDPSREILKILRLAGVDKLLEIRCNPVGENANETGSKQTKETKEGSVLSLEKESV